MDLETDLDYIKGDVEIFLFQQLAIGMSASVPLEQAVRIVRGQVADFGMTHGFMPMIPSRSPVIFSTQ